MSSTFPQLNGSTRAAIAGGAGRAGPGIAGTERLLSAVVAASRELLAADLDAGLRGALRALGEGTGLDRVYAVRYDHAARAGFFVAEHCAPGIASVTELMGAGPYGYADYEEVWRPLLAGEIYTSPTRGKTGANAEHNQATGTKSDLMVPVFLGSVFWGMLGFDDCTTERVYGAGEIEVLRGAAAALAAALTRGEAQAAVRTLERARADEAMALNHLLEGVVAASRALLDEPDFQSGLQRWLAALAAAVDADRAIVGQFAAPDDSACVAIHQISWTKRGVPDLAQIPIPASSDFVAWAERLRRGESVWAHRDELIDPCSVRFWKDTDCYTNLIVPVVVERRTVAWLCFDWRARREWKPAYGTLLRTAADGAAAAIKRNEAVRAMLAEREGRAADPAAVNRELEQRNRLLAAAARASALLSAREDFDAAVVEAMGLVAEAAEFDRIVLVEHLDAHGNPGAEFWRVTHEWHRPGVVAQRESAVSEGSFADAPMFVSELLISERVLEFTTPEIPDEGFRRVQETLGARLLVAGNIFIDGFSWGAFACDDCRTERRRTAEEKAVIATAARAVGQAVYRRRLERRAKALQLQIVTEREEAAQDRVAELASINEELRLRDTLLTVVTRVTRSLLGSENFEASLQEALRELGEAAQMHRVKVILERPHLAPVAAHHELVHEWWAPHLVSQSSLGVSHFPNDVVEEYISPLREGHSLWHLLDHVPESLREPFRRAGMRSMGVVPIFSGKNYVGLVAFDDCVKPRQWSQAEMDALTIGAQAIGAAIQSRKLENEKIEAVAAERTRIARDLHDTLAQGFTGVLAQLGAAEGAVETGRLGEMSSYLDRAKALARFSLAEARSSVHALRPEANPAPLATRLRQMLAGMTQGTSLDAAVEENGEPGRLGPAADWCVHKFVQESLANAVKHAGARTFRVEVAWGAELSVCAWDDGRGFDPATTPPGLGLLTMRERAAEADGTITNESRPGHGTRLCLIFNRKNFSPSPDVQKP